MEKVVKSESEKVKSELHKLELELKEWSPVDWHGVFIVVLVVLFRIVLGLLSSC